MAAQSTLRPGPALGLVAFPPPRLSLITGIRPHIGVWAVALFLIPVTVIMHNFWALEGHEQQEQTIQFMKNLSMFGAMLFLIANGPGAWSLDACLAKQTPAR